MRRRATPAREAARSATAARRRRRQRCARDSARRAAATRRSSPGTTRASAARVASSRSCSVEAAAIARGEGGVERRLAGLDDGTVGARAEPAGVAPLERERRIARQRSPMTTSTQRHLARRARQRQRHRQRLRRRRMHARRLIAARSGQRHLRRTDGGGARRTRFSKASRAIGVPAPRSTDSATASSPIAASAIWNGA